MKLLFIDNPNALEEFISPMYISSVLKKHGHHCDVLMENGPDKIVKYVNKTSPDFAGFFHMPPWHNWMMRVAKKIKEMTDCKTIVGGVHPTLYPEIVEKECIDFVCRGEGEYAMLEFAERFDSDGDLTDIENIWTVVDGKIKENPVRPLIEDLDELPFPDRDLYYGKCPERGEVGNFRVSSGRGCPFNCSYCYNNLINDINKEGNSYRKRSPKNIIKELKNLMDKYNPRKIDFSQDTFLCRNRKQWLYRFLELYKKEIDIPFGIQVHPKLIRSKEVKKLKESGCYSIRIGVETGNEKIRKEVLNKNITNKRLLKASRLIKKSSIDLVTYNMMGLPGETPKDALKTVKFNQKLKPDYTLCQLLQPFPKTQIAEYAKEHGYLPGDYNLDDYVRKMDNIRNPWHKFHGKPEYKRELKNLSYLFQIVVKFPKTTPLIKHLIKKPTNKVYEAIGQVLYGSNLILSYNMNKTSAMRQGLFSTFKNKI